MQTLTPAQRTQWSVNGYLHLEGALTPGEVAFFNAELERIRHVPGWEPSKVQLGHYGWLPHCVDERDGGFMDRRDLLPYHQAFIDLMDRPNVFDLVVDLMGPNLLLSMSQAIIRPPTPEFKGYTHTDGGEALRRIRVTESSWPLALKALYLLTDVSESDTGNFTVFPGSHMRPFQEQWRLTPQSPGAVQLMGKAGDCYLFPHSLWHGPAANLGNRSRATLLYNYCQLFVRWYDFAQVSAVIDRCTPRQRRLLGDLGHEFRPGDYFYVPVDQQHVIES